MGALDIFSGETGRNAAIWSAGNTQAGANQQRGYINTGATQSLAALGQGATQARKDVTGQYGAGLNALGKGFEGAFKNYGVNQGIIDTYRQNADNFYAPLGEEANRGFSVYGDAAGINGGAGQDRARASFRTGPGYQFMLGEGINAATRAANATGMGASGNTMQSVQKYGSGLADQQWDDYMAHLAPYLNLAPSIAGKRAENTQHFGDLAAANQAAIAGLYTGSGKDVAALRMGQGNTLASLASGLGSNRAGIYGDQSRNLANITGAETAAITGQGQAGLMAGQAANQNTWNAGMQLANLAVSAAPKVVSAFK